MKKKYKMAAAALLIMAAALAGCAQKEETGQDGLTAVNISYAAMQGIEFTSQREFVLPAVAYFNDAEGNGNIDMSEQGVSISCSGASYRFEEVAVSGPDENGNVVMNIAYTISAENTITQDVSYQYGGEILSSTGWRTIGMFDYYTGHTIPETNSNEDGIIESSIVLDGCTLDYNLSRRSTSAWGAWENLEGDLWELKGMMACTYRYAVTMPADYDGLCLYLCLSGRAEYADFDNEGQSVSRPVLENLKEGQTLEDYAFIRVSDLLASYE